MTRYIKFLFLMVIVMVETCSCHPTSPNNENTDASSLPVPRLKYLKVEDPATIIVKWHPVKISSDNPILGYKVKLWEEEKKIVAKFVEKDGKMELVTEIVPVEKSSHGKPTHAPAFTATVPPTSDTATFKNVKLGVHYEIRVQTYNEHGDGPLSSASGILIRDDEKSTGSPTAQKE